MWNISCGTYDCTSNRQANQFDVPACLGLFEAAHMPELLRDAGDVGMSTAQIAKKTGIQEMRVGTLSFATRNRMR